MSTRLIEIEHTIRALSVDEQLWLLERIAHELRQKTQTAALPLATFNLEKQLAEMANDPAVQVKLVAIEQEFTFAEMDGLKQSLSPRLPNRPTARQ